MSICGARRPHENVVLWQKMSKYGNEYVDFQDTIIDLMNLSAYQAQKQQQLYKEIKDRSPFASIRKKDVCSTDSKRTEYDPRNKAVDSNRI